jgi:phthalate 4,5-cis-dihydrodiol dehydrogenase
MRLSDRLRVGLLGLGMAGGVMASALAGHPRAHLVAAADVDEDLRARFTAHTGLPAEISAEALAARTDVDAIYIATPHHLHARHAARAAAHGKHIVVEKPMALSLADCDAMIAAAETNGVTLIVGHTHAFDPAISEMRRLSTTDSIGPIAHITALNFTDFLYRSRRADELDPDKGGGVLWNQVPHQIDMARLLIAKPVIGVRAELRTLDPGRRVAGFCSAFLTFEGGASAQVTYSGYDRFDSDEWFDWIGEIGIQRAPAHGNAQRAIASLDHNDEARDRRDRLGFGGAFFQAVKTQHQPHFGALIAHCAHADLRATPKGVRIYGPSGIENVDLEDADAWVGQRAVWDEVYAAIRHKRPALRNGTFARETVETCLAIAESARTNREVFLA